MSSQRSISSIGSRSISQRCLGKRYQSHKYCDKHWAVGVSALCCVPPAITYAGYGLCGIVNGAVNPWDEFEIFPKEVYIVIYCFNAVMWTGVTLTCFLADFAYVRTNHQTRYGIIDVRLTTFAMVVACVDGFTRNDVWVAIVPFAGFSAFLASGMANSFERWVVLHCLWHVVAGSSGVVLAANRPPARSSQVMPFLIVVGGSYFILIFSAIVCWFCLSIDARMSLWQFGERYADWQPFDGTAPDTESGVHPTQIGADTGT